MLMIAKNYTLILSYISFDSLATYDLIKLYIYIQKLLLDITRLHLLNSLQTFLLKACSNFITFCIIKTTLLCTWKNRLHQRRSYFLSLYYSYYNILPRWVTKNSTILLFSDIKTFANCKIVLRYEIQFIKILKTFLK